MPKQPIKTISKASDLEGIQNLEKVKVNYYYPSSKYKNEPIKDRRGIFAGRFDINNNKYFVLSEARAAKMYSDKLFVCSGLYKGEEDHIIYEGTYTQNHCNCDKSGSASLENEVKRQFTKLNEKKLNEQENQNKNKLII